MIRRSILFAYFICLCITSASAQQTRHHGVFWGRLVLADRFNQKAGWELYMQKRTQNVPGSKNIFDAPHFTSFWLWLNYNLTTNTKLSVSPFGYFDSYTFLTTPSDVDIPGIKEFRWTVRLEQLQRLKFFNLSHRYSVEYRRRDLLNDDVYRGNWRLRYQVRAEKPVLGVFSKRKPVTFFLSEELFIQFGRAVRSNPNVFDQNRIAAGFSYEVFPNIKTSLSYLNIIQERNSGRDFDDAHTIWMVVTLDNLFSQFRKK